VAAVNADGTFGWWAYVMTKKVIDITEIIELQNVSDGR